MFSLFARAAAGLNLTPAERAFLRLLEGLTGTFGLAAVTAGAQYLNGGAVASWQAVLDVAVAAGLNAVWLALLKYRSAKGDAPIEITFAPTSKAVAPAPAPAPAPAGPSGSAL